MVLTIGLLILIVFARLQYMEIHHTRKGNTEQVISLQMQMDSIANKNFEMERQISRYKLAMDILETYNPSCFEEYDTIVKKLNK